MYVQRILLHLNDGTDCSNSDLFVNLKTCLSGITVDGKNAWALVDFNSLQNVNEYCSKMVIK
jgi:hypothetical protein